MRGKPVTSIIRLIRSGITPAYAGKTKPDLSHGRLPGDHPRVCGENRVGKKSLKDKLGSPPRMRGKLVDIVVWVVGLRITPAYAGKTRRTVA